MLLWSSLQHLLVNGSIDLGGDHALLTAGCQHGHLGSHKDQYALTNSTHFTNNLVTLAAKAYYTCVYVYGSSAYEENLEYGLGVLGHLVLHVLEHRQQRVVVKEHFQGSPPASSSLRSSCY